MSSSMEQNDLTNQSIAGFSILHRLGVGGMSEVYLAFQESLHRHVALKVMRADFVGSSDHEQRFLQEARAVASLMHPNIVQVYDVGRFESVHYIAQEYVPGSNLHSYIQRRGALPLAESVSILWQATAALQKAASIGLVHRDIKPDNLLLTPDGEVKVADFGLARARGQSQNLTAVGVTLGTPLYMSPEQIQGLTVDSRSDLYSLGATAYHMLAGRPPFAGETALALAMQHLQAEPVPLQQLRPDLPQSLISIVQRLMAKSPEDRFASAAELARALREVVDASLAGKANEMVPFQGLVVEHQFISNLQVTQELQKLSKQSLSHAGVSFNIRKIAGRVGVVAGSMLVGLLSTLYAFQDDFLSRESRSTAGVAKRSNIQQQYALALLENDLKHWNGVSEFFPPDDAVSRDYFLKSKLQTARWLIEREGYGSAAETAFEVLQSPYADPVMRTMATIEIGFLSKKVVGEKFSSNFYDDAAREMDQLDVDKQKMIRELLPSRVRLEWEQYEISRQSTGKEQTK